MPIRIQRKRTKAWKMPENTVEDLVRQVRDDYGVLELKCQVIPVK